MKIVHKSGDQKAEKEVGDSTQLGLFISNKKGGALIFDSRKDITRFYVPFEGSALKVLSDIRTPGKVSYICNSIYAATIARHDKEEQELDIFVPYYMDALLIRTNEHPVSLKLDGFRKSTLTSDQAAGTPLPAKCLLLSKDITGKGPVYVAIQGDGLKYDYTENSEGQAVANILCSRFTVAADTTPHRAAATTNHLLANEAQVRAMQEQYTASPATFKDEEIALAYSCVMNGIDNIFNSSPQPGAKPIRTFVDVRSPYTAIAINALLLEGEYKTAKNALLREFNVQLSEYMHGEASFHQTAWPVLILGRMLNTLCNKDKLMQYFSVHEIGQISKDVQALISKDMTICERHADEEPAAILENDSIRLSIYDLSQALSPSEDLQQKEDKLREETAALVEYTMQEKTLAPKDIRAVYMAAYVYPQLLSDSSWKAMFDKILEQIHHDFRTLRQKTSQSQDDASVKLEIFGLSSLAALAMYRTDPEHYEDTVNKILRSNVTDALYKGYIGRPSSSFDQTSDPDGAPIIRNEHLLNSALFLELLRTIRG